MSYWGVVLILHYVAVVVSIAFFVAVVIMALSLKEPDEEDHYPFR